MASDLWALFALCCISVATVLCEKKENYGPYDVKIDELTKCDDEGLKELILENLQVKVGGKMKFITTVEATNKFVVDDNVTVLVEVASQKDGIYGPKIMKLPVGPICTALHTYFPKSADKFYHHIGVKGCPVETNTWKIKEYPFELDPPLKELPYKHFRADVSFYIGKSRMSCVRCFFETVPMGTVKY